MNQIDELLSSLMQPQAGALNLPDQSVVANTLIGQQYDPMPHVPAPPLQPKEWPPPPRPIPIQYSMMDDPRARGGKDQFGNELSGGGGAGGFDRLRGWEPTPGEGRPGRPSTRKLPGQEPTTLDKIRDFQLEKERTEAWRKELILRHLRDSAPPKPPPAPPKPMMQQPSAPRPFDPSLWK